MGNKHPLRPMFTADVRARIRDIEEMEDDPEAAHGAEDQLYIDVLAVIADGAANAKSLAHAALETRKLTFPRWGA